MALRVLLPREMRTETDYSPPFYTRASKLHFHTTIEVGGPLEFHLYEGWDDPEGEFIWHELHESTLPMDGSGEWSVIVHNQLLPITPYDAETERVRLWVPTNAPLRVGMVMEGDRCLYSLAVSEGISRIEGPDS